MAPLDSLPPYSRLDDVPPCYDPDQALAEFNGLSSDQQAQLSKSLSQAASGDDAVSQLKKSATDAATAAAAIDDLFDDLTSKLISLKITDQDFVNRFEKIHKNYRKILSHSRDQATDISQYAESFDEIVINFCADKTLDVERRKKKIQEFINDGDDIKKESEKLQESFDGLKDDLKTFLSDFSEWAEPREEADEEKIKELTKQISDLNDQLNSIDTAISSIGSALAVTLPVTGALALIFPPAAPWIMIAGCTLAGLELGSVVGLLIAKNLIMKDKKSKEDAIKDLDGEIGEIKATRTQLKDVGDSYYKKFKTNINALSKTWVHVQSDAKEIHKWLQDGADDADQPEYMKQSLEHAVTIYTSMAKYLKEYADGTALTVQEFKATK